MVDCYEPLPILRGAKGEGEESYKGETYLLYNSNSKEKIKVKFWSPNKILVRVENLEKEDWLVVNQNYDPHWIIIIDNKKYKSGEFDGLIAAPLKPKSQEKSVEIIFEYQFLPFLINEKI